MGLGVLGLILLRRGRRVINVSKVILLLNREGSPHWNCIPWTLLHNPKDWPVFDGSKSFKSWLMPTKKYNYVEVYGAHWAPSSSFWAFRASWISGFVPTALSQCHNNRLSFSSCIQDPVIMAVLKRLLRITGVALQLKPTHTTCKTQAPQWKHITITIFFMSSLRVKLLCQKVVVFVTDCTYHASQSGAMRAHCRTHTCGFVR